jgi:hypothetical protein
MTPLEAIVARANLARKRRALAKKEEWAKLLQDQIDSGRWALDRVNEEIEQLRAEAFALENPIEILHRAGI